jgi:hypothetical protein
MGAQGPEARGLTSVLSRALLWGAGRGRLVGSVVDVAISSDGALAATASTDFSARVW